MANRISTPVVDRKSNQKSTSNQKQNEDRPPARIEVSEQKAEDQVVLLDARRRTMSGKTRRQGRSDVDSPNTQIGEQIGKELRVLYEEVVTQPIPDRFLELLNELEKTTISNKGDKKTPEGR